MKKSLLVITLLIITTLGYSQKPLSPATIKDFSTQCYYSFRYGSDYMKALLITVLNSKGYSYSECAVVVELENNIENGPGNNIQNGPPNNMYIGPLNNIQTGPI